MTTDQKLVKTYEAVIQRQLASGGTLEDCVGRTYLEHMARMSWLRLAEVTVLLFWGLALAALIMSSGCGHTPNPVPTVPRQFTVTPPQMSAADRAVRIERTCMQGDPQAPAGQNSLTKKQGATGSGVIAGPETVLTAWHVVECPPGTARFLYVVGTDEVKRWAEVTGADPSHDLARLTVRGAQASKVEIVKPIPGEDVCMVLGHPTRELSCGRITNIAPLKTKTNGTVDVWHTARTVPGNSGSGVYNNRGQLVGLLTNGDTKGGLASSLAGRVP